MTRASRSYDAILRGGLVVDGSGARAYRADVGLTGDRIASLADLSQATADLDIDATGKVVAPGFVDAHTHDDYALIDQPDMAMKVSQGVTTVVVGNCGFSAMPLPADGELPPSYLVRGARDLRFAGLALYFEFLERNPAAVNSAGLIGHSALRLSSMAEIDRPATSDEVAAMRRLLARDMDAGAVGFSTGLEYPTNRAASTEEVIAVANAVEPFEGVCTIHNRNYDKRLKEGMEEALLIGREARVRVVLSHHQGDGPENVGHAGWTLGLIEQARGRQSVGLDVHPYTAAATMIHPDFVYDDSRTLVTSSQPHPEMAGRDLSDIAAAWGVSEREAAEKLMPGGAIYFCQDEADVRAILAFPATMIGSDGLPGLGIPHPRLWGTFPRVLGRSVRELKLMSIESAVHKMTGLTAERFGLSDRGLLQVGMAADITVFDPATVIDRASYEEPDAVSEGICHVLVNGTAVRLDGRPTGQRPGKPLRRGRRSSWAAEKRAWRSD
ncbi:MAG TPA: D-aminoacylase [Candidatus Udaeobacter sp.]|nr:D-aminoacylase [Candidatus Udaeobacter sp.]